MNDKINPLEHAQESEVTPQEIERKFIVKELPADLEKYPHKEIIQGYVVIADDGTEVRLRRKGEKFIQTVKRGKGKTREEFETEINEEQFNAFWGATKGKRVEKTRYNIEHDGLVIEFDVYHGDLDGLMSAEIEFEDEKQSNDFVPPEWIGEEVTEDHRYKNQSLAMHGAPHNGNEKE